MNSTELQGFEVEECASSNNQESLTTSEGMDLCGSQGRQARVERS